MTRAEGAVRESAAELGLPQEREGLEGVRTGLQSLGVALAGVWPAIVALDRAREAAVDAGKDVESAARELLEHDERRRAAEREATERKERHDTLAQTVGAAVAELQRRLAGVASELRANARAQGEAEERRLRAASDEGREDGRRQQLAVQLEQATEQRLADVDALRRFASTGLIAVALGEVELPEDGEGWSVRAGLRVARLIEQELADAPDDEPALRRASSRVTDELNTLGDALRRHGNNASATMPEEGIVVEVVFRGHTTTVPELASALAEEVGDRERLLDEREREILENHLVGEVAGTLQELISDAEQRVGDVNGELADRPTSTGMRLRLRWRVAEDGPQGLAEARERLLRQSADAWSEEDRAAVGAFLQAQIQEVRSRDVAGTWIEQLTEALDYRAWHRFAIERHQGGAWRSATGPASGGERVLDGERAPVCGGVLLLHLGGQPQCAAPGDARRGVRRCRRRLARQVLRAANRVRPGRGDDQRARVGLLPRGARARRSHSSRAWTASRRCSSAIGSGTARRARRSSGPWRLSRRSRR